MQAGSPVILFDGVCNLCHGLVQFIIQRDPHARFRFASLQSAEGQRLMPGGVNPDPDNPDSVVLIEDGRAYTHSTAILRILRRLGGGWALLAVAGLLPRSLRDAAYRFVARNRYRWFGKQTECWLPTPELKARFL
ncbi:thiol-disulfide oxidoreductase DCC family protein [Hymenobacter jeollabukensis]|uniref:Thiol-disulfide oxidoreductase DCC family protein n=1 Tax=Hymenobacter jeollabukensis TaxID=2025313 RepID=A0A5R8WML0_9BACT|nr:thiol-disulfide oxidoreductase DCC family protein [Hymenobacter jeollabukensis]TLM90129.1 thiol-disulfide oxidoreductase DCC family protein [Hymenobacter jeollabukensis]